MVFVGNKLAFHEDGLNLIFIVIDVTAKKVPGYSFFCTGTSFVLHFYRIPQKKADLISNYIFCCREAFHCEVYARPQVVKARAELTKQDMLAMALQMYQKQLKQAEAADAQRPEPAEGLTDEIL